MLSGVVKFNFLDRIHVCSVGYAWRKQIVGYWFGIADVFFVSGVYASTGLSYILLITRVAFQAVNTTRVLLVVWVSG